MYASTKDLRMLGPDPGTRRGARAETVTVPPCAPTGRWAP
jgi:hypothetical protein